MDFRGSYTVSVTPFTADGSALDLDAQRRFIDWQLECGVPGLIIFGSTGEFLAISDAERTELVRATVEHVAGRIPVLVGTMNAFTPNAVRYSQEAQELGADGLMIAPPYYYTPTEDEIFGYYEAICDAVDLPIMIYNNPVTTNVDISAALVGKLTAELSNIRYIKEASLDVARVYDVIEATDGVMNVFAGERVGRVLSARRGRLRQPVRQLRAARLGAHLRADGRRPRRGGPPDRAAPGRDRPRHRRRPPDLRPPVLLQGAGRCRRRADGRRAPAADDVRIARRRGRGRGGQGQRADAGARRPGRPLLGGRRRVSSDDGVPAVGDLSGRVVLVTGASKGIGAAIVGALGRAGASVIAAYGSDHDGAVAATAGIAPERVLRLALDLAAPGAGRRLWASALAWKGRIDVVVANAAVMLDSPLQASDADWDAAWATMLAVNVVEPANLMREAARHFVATGGGVLIALSSWSAQRGSGNPDLIAYSATKAAIKATAQTLARSHAADGLLVYVIAPGIVRTQMSEVSAQALGGEAAVTAGLAMGEWVPPQEIAALVTFLSTGTVRHLSGATLDVNGASYIR